MTSSHPPYCSSLLSPPPRPTQLHYTFEMVLLLQEPLLVMIAFYLLFLLVIVFVRLDFSITKV